MKSHECCDDAKKEMYKIFVTEIEGIYGRRIAECILPDSISKEQTKNGKIFYGICVTGHPAIGYIKCKIIYCPWCGEKLEVDEEETNGL